MEKWETRKQRKQQKQVEQEDHQRRKKAGNYENQDLVKHLQKQSKWILIAFIFDLIHYNIYPLFNEDSQLYVYDASQSIAFLFYIYAIYKLIPEELILMHFITSAWLWFSIGDVFNVVYNTGAIQGLRLENWCLLFNILVFSYKFRYELLLRLEILICYTKLMLI